MPGWWGFWYLRDAGRGRVCGTVPWSDLLQTRFPRRSLFLGAFWRVQAHPGGASRYGRAGFQRKIQLLQLQRDPSRQHFELEVSLQP